jgi:acetyltransferase-like isoleucine patch superfamily enzyme
MGWLTNKMLDNFAKLSKLLKAREIARYKKSGQLLVGEHSYGINHLTIHTYKGSESKVRIGKFCSLGPNLLIITGGIHPVDWVSTFPFRIKWNLEGKYQDGMPQTKGDVLIGNDVWIGSGVTILSGVKVAHGSILAANSLVTKDVAPYSIVGGNPAKLIKNRFSEDIVDTLMKSCWWDLPDEVITDLVPLLSSSQVNEFIVKVNTINEKVP